MRQLIAALKAGDVLLRSTVRFFDEPDLSHPAPLNALRTLAELLLDIESGLTVSIATSYPHPELDDVFRLWILHTDTWDRELRHIQAARAAGCSISVYNNGVNYPEHRPLRVQLWP